MAAKTSASSLSSFFFVISFLQLSMFSSAKHGPNIRGMFVFGSSLVDNGNNNYFKNSLAKADYLPYGVDFPLGSSGRFTNGKNMIDLLGELLKLPTFIPAFADPSTRGTRILRGVNFASGASGILDDTGAIAGQVFSLKNQVDNFQNVTLPDFEKQLGKKSGKSLLNYYLFVVGSGGNDYTFNYFMNRDNSNVSLQEFTAKLTTCLSHQLQRLYHLGARKFVLMSINPNGCTPMAMSHEGCVQSVNRAVHLFNSNLKTLVDDLKLKIMPASNLVFVNSYKILMDIIKDPVSKGFNDTKKPCCEVPSVEEGGTGTLCRRSGSICSDRRTKVFFDGLHPTEAVNLIIAEKAYHSFSRTEVYPINVEQLAKL